MTVSVSNGQIGHEMVVSSHRFQWSSELVGLLISTLKGPHDQGLVSRSRYEDGGVFVLSARVTTDDGGYLVGVAF